MRSTMFSPCVGGQARHPEVHHGPDIVSEMRPSCGARVSAMFIFDITFRRTAIAGQ
jgi:hypothetical protein